MILTIIVAAVTGGVGVVAAIGSKAHLIKKFQKVGDLLSDFAKATRKLKLEGKKRKAKGNNAKFSDFDIDEVQAKKTNAHGAEDGKVSKAKEKTEKEVVLEARQRQEAMLEDNIGFNVSPSDWDNYPTIVSAQATPPTNLNNRQLYIFRQQFFNIFHRFTVR